MKNNIDIILKGSVLKMVCKLSLPNFLGVSSMPIIIFMKIIIGIEETPKKLGKDSLQTIFKTEPFNIISMLFFISSVVSLYYKDRGGQSPFDFRISNALKVFSTPSFTVIDG